MINSIITLSLSISMFIYICYRQYLHTLRIQNLNQELQQHTQNIKKLEDILFGFDKVRFPAVEHDLSVKEKIIYREIDEVRKEFNILKRTLEAK